MVNKPVSADYLESSLILFQKEVVASLSEVGRNQPFAYTVQQGDTLYSIGSQFKVSVDALKYINGLTDSSVLSVGKEITIPRCQV